MNGIMPGATETEALQAVLDQRPAIREQLIEHTRLRRNGTPEDIGLAAVYLASPAVSWVTGKLLEIDGGTVDELAQMFPDL